MIDKRLKNKKSPNALIWGAIFIFFLVIAGNIPLSSANAPVFSIKIENKSLPEAMEAIAERTQTKITLIGEIESTVAKSVTIENQSLPEVIKTILNRYRVPNYAILYDDGARLIKIRLVASSSSQEHTFGSMRSSDTGGGESTSTRMFSDQDFARLLEKGRTTVPEKEFSEEDFARLHEKNDATVPEHKEFSATDFAKVTSQKSDIEEYPVFSSGDFARLPKNPDSQEEYRLFSNEDFTNVLNNQKTAPN